MATPIWFSGSSPDAAFAREDAWRRERLGVLEGDRSSRAQAESQSLQAFLQNQGREDQLREMDLSRTQRADEMAAAQQNNMRNFFAGQAERASDKAEQRPFMEATIADLKSRTKATDAAVEQSKLISAQAAADQGLILDPTEAANVFGIDLNAAKRLHAQSKATQDRIDKQDADLAAAASELTQYAVAKKSQNALTAALPLDTGIWPFRGTSADVVKKHQEAVDETNHTVQRLQKRVDFLQSPKSEPILNQLQFDPETGGYHYIPPPRPWRVKASATSTGTTPAFFAPQPAPSFAAPQTSDFLTPPPSSAMPLATNSPALRPITRDVAIQFLRQANGDRNLARKLARDAGFSF